VHKRAEYAQKAIGLKGKMFAKKRHQEKAQMKKTIAMHEERENKHKADDGAPQNAVPAYLLERDQASAGARAAHVAPHPPPPHGPRCARAAAAAAPLPRPSTPCLAGHARQPRSRRPAGAPGTSLHAQRALEPAAAALPGCRWIAPKCCPTPSNRSARRRRGSGRCRCPRCEAVLLLPPGREGPAGGGCSGSTGAAGTPRGRPVGACGRRPHHRGERRRRASPAPSCRSGRWLRTRCSRC